KCLRVLALNHNSTHMRDIEYPGVRPNSLAFGNYSLEPYGKLVASVINDVAVFLMIVVDLCSLPHGQPCWKPLADKKKGDYSSKLSKNCFPLVLETTRVLV